MLTRGGSGIIFLGALKAAIAHFPMHEARIRRFFSRIEVREDGCWEFLDAKEPKHKTNYGVYGGCFGVLGAHVYAYIYTLATLDHQKV